MAASFPRSAERTRAEILDVATRVFARGGFAGARVDEIAALTSTTKRMIYYYFGGKEQLYQAVLLRATASLRPPVPITAADEGDPLGLIHRLIDQTFAQYRAHPDYIRLLVTENLQAADTLPAPDPAPPPDSASGPPGELDPASQLEAFQRVLDAGIARGLLRPDLLAVDIVMIIDAVCQYQISGRITHRIRCGIDLLDAASASQQRQLLTTLVFSFVAG